MNNLNQFIEQEATVRGGVVVLKGTRFPLGRVFSEIAEGVSLDDVAEDYSLDLNLLQEMFRELAREYEKPNVPRP